MLHVKPTKRNSTAKLLMEKNIKNTRVVSHQLAGKVNSVNLAKLQFKSLFTLYWNRAG